LAACGRKVTGPVAELPIAEVTADSRRVVPGALFVAVSGGKADGHDFLSDAVAAGCRAVVVERPAAAVGMPVPVPVIRVADSRVALGQLVAAWYGNPAARVVTIGITGTNGKTTTAYLVEAILQAAGHRPGLIGTVEYRCAGFRRPAALTTPDAEQLQNLLADMVAAGVTHVVMEASSHALDQGRLAGVAFDVAVFTNLSRDHLDYHHDMEAYFLAKRLLFERHLKPGGAAVILQPEDEERRQPAVRLTAWLEKRRVRMVRCGGGLADLRPVSRSLDIHGSRCAIDTPAGSITVRSPLVGEHNLENLLTAAGVGIALGLDPAAIGAGLSQPVQIPGRLERVRRRPAVFVDYAHTPDGLAQVLTTLRRLAPGRLVVVFGCGGDRDRGKRPQMGEIAGRLADLVIVTTDNPRSESPAAILAAIEAGVQRTGMRRCRAELGLRHGWRGFYDVISDRRQAIRVAVSRARADDVVLLAGKGHEDYQLVAGRRIFFDDRLEASLVARTE